MIQFTPISSPMRFYVTYGLSNLFTFLGLCTSSELIYLKSVVLIYVNWISPRKPNLTSHDHDRELKLYSYRSQTSWSAVQEAYEMEKSRYRRPKGKLYFSILFRASFLPLISLLRLGRTLSVDLPKEDKERGQITIRPVVIQSN